MRQEPLDHLLLIWPSRSWQNHPLTNYGTGNGVGIKICSGPTLERTGDLVAILSSLQTTRRIFYR